MVFGTDARGIVRLTPDSIWPSRLDPERPRPFAVGDSYFFYTGHWESYACGLTTPLGTVQADDFIGDARRLYGEPKRFTVPDTSTREPSPPDAMPATLGLLASVLSVAAVRAVRRRSALSQPARTSPTSLRW